MDILVLWKTIYRVVSLSMTFFNDVFVKKNGYPCQNIAWWLENSFHIMPWNDILILTLG